MLFTSVGSFKNTFDRLINQLEKLPVNLKNQILYQGHIDNSKQVSFKAIPFISREDFYNYLKDAEVVIIHCGIGTIYDCVKMKKKTIIIPRLAQYGEHINNHQLQIYNELIKRPLPNIYPLDNIENLQSKIEELITKDIDNSPFKSGIFDLKEQIQKDIEQLIFNKNKLVKE